MLLSFALLSFGRHPSPGNKKAARGRLTSTWEHVLYVMIAIVARWREVRCVIGRHSTRTRAVSQRNPTGIVVDLGTSLCMNGGRGELFWGLKKKFGDNPGDSKIPLDLGLCIRECIRRTGERTPTGAG
jgi:hypothetical protein